MRERLWRSRRWRKDLRKMLEELQESGASPDLAELAYEVATAMEAVTIEPKSAAEAYLVAWQCARDRLELLSRARRLCREAREHTNVAKIAKLQYQKTKDPSFCYHEGIAWLDADEHERAVRPLLLARQAATAMPGLDLALAVAQREWTSVQGLLEDVESQAYGEIDRGRACQMFLMAARIYRLLGEDPEGYLLNLERAFDADRLNDSAYLLLVDALVSARDPDRLLEIHRLRADACDQLTDQIEVYRRAGTEFLVRGLDAVTGARLLTLAVNATIENQVASLSPIATLDLLEKYHRRADTLETFVELAEVSLSATVDADVEVWTAIKLLDIGWGELGSASAAAAATVLRDRAPQNPALQEFYDSGGQAALDLSSASQEMAAVSEPMPTDVEPIEDYAAAGPAPIPIPVPEYEEPEATPSPPKSAFDPSSLIPGSARSALQNLARPQVPPDTDELGAHRLQMTTSVRLTLPGQQTATAGVTRELGAGGFSVLTAATLEVGTTLDVELELPSIDNPWAVSVHRCSCTVVRATPGSAYGLRFVDPPESLVTHLQALEANN